MTAAVAEHCAGLTRPSVRGCKTYGRSGGGGRALRGITT